MLLGKAVPIKTRAGNVEVVVTVPQAAEVLTERWPERPDSRKQIAARRAVLKALQSMHERKFSHQAASTAADALEAAAKEAGILEKR